METPPIDTLRNAFAQSIIATMATQVGTYMRLVAHPEVQFGDFLDALERNAVIADDAAQRLHRRLNLPAGSGAPMVQRGYWEQVLAERSIALVTPFRVQAERAASGRAPLQAPAAVPAHLPEHVPAPTAAGEGEGEGAGAGEGAGGSEPELKIT